MQRLSFMNKNQNTSFRENMPTNNHFFHLPRLPMQGPQLSHISTPMIYTCQQILMDQTLQSWLEMGLQGYTLIFTMELNNQEVVLLAQNPTHLAKIVTKGIRLGMEAYTQNQWYTTQTPLLLKHQASSSTQSPWPYLVSPMSPVWN